MISNKKWKRSEEEKEKRWFEVINCLTKTWMSTKLTMIIMIDLSIHNKLDGSGGK